MRAYWANRRSSRCRADLNRQGPRGVVQRLISRRQALRFERPKMLWAEQRDGELYGPSITSVRCRGRAARRRMRLIWLAEGPLVHC
jgi:hypothetical protein